MNQLSDNQYKRQFYRNLYKKIDEKQRMGCIFCGGPCSCCCGCKFSSQLLKFCSKKSLDYFHRIIEEFEKWIFEDQATKDNFIKLGLSVPLPKDDEFLFFNEGKSNNSNNDNNTSNNNNNNTDTNTSIPIQYDDPYNNDLCLALIGENNTFKKEEEFPETLLYFVQTALSDPLTRIKYWSWYNSDCILKRITFYSIFFHSDSYEDNLLGGTEFFFKNSIENEAIIKKYGFQPPPSISFNENIENFINNIYLNEKDISKRNSIFQRIKSYLEDNGCDYKRYSIETLFQIIEMDSEIYTLTYFRGNSTIYKILKTILSESNFNLKYMDRYEKIIPIFLHYFSPNDNEPISMSKFLIEKMGREQMDRILNQIFKIYINLEQTKDLIIALRTHRMFEFSKSHVTIVVEKFYNFIGKPNETFIYEILGDFLITHFHVMDDNEITFQFIMTVLKNHQKHANYKEIMAILFSVDKFYKFIFQMENLVKVAEICSDWFNIVRIFKTFQKQPDFHSKCTQDSYLTNLRPILLKSASVYPLIMEFDLLQLDPIQHAELFQQSQPFFDRLLSPQTSLALEKTIIPHFISSMEFFIKKFPELYDDIITKMFNTIFVLPYHEKYNFSVSLLSNSQDLVNYFNLVQSQTPVTSKILIRIGDLPDVFHLIRPLFTKEFIEKLPAYFMSNRSQLKSMMLLLDELKDSLSSILITGSIEFLKECQLKLEKDSFIPILKKVLACTPYTTLSKIFEGWEIPLDKQEVFNIVFETVLTKPSNIHHFILLFSDGIVNGEYPKFYEFFNSIPRSVQKKIIKSNFKKDSKDNYKKYKKLFLKTIIINSNNDNISSSYLDSIEIDSKLPFLPKLILKRIIEFVYKDKSIPPKFKISLATCSSLFFDTCSSIIMNSYDDDDKQLIPIKEPVNFNSKFILIKQVPKHVSVSDLLKFPIEYVYNGFHRNVESLQLDRCILKIINEPLAIKSLVVSRLNDDGVGSNCLLFSSALENLVKNSPELHTIRMLPFITRFTNHQDFKQFADLLKEKCTLLRNVHLEINLQQQCDESLNSAIYATNVFKTFPSKVNIQIKGTGNLKAPTATSEFFEKVCGMVTSLLQDESKDFSFDLPVYSHFTSCTKLTVAFQSFSNILNLLRQINSNLTSVRRVCFKITSRNFQQYSIPESNRIEKYMIEIFNYLNNENIHINEFSIYLKTDKNLRESFFSKQTWDHIIFNSSGTKSCFQPTSLNNYIRFKIYN